MFREKVYKSSKCEERGIQEDRRVRIEGRAEEDGCYIEEEVNNECEGRIWFKKGLPRL